MKKPDLFRICILMVSLLIVYMYTEPNTCIEYRLYYMPGMSP